MFLLTKELITMIKKITISVGILLSTLSIQVTAGNLSTSNMIEGTGYVYRVIDGDTYDINADSQDIYDQLKSSSSGKELKYFKDKYKNFRIRLANTNTAESKHPDAHRNSAEGQNASSYAKKLIEKKKIHFSCWDHGRYGRLICSVSIDGKDVGINLIENGYSDYVTSWGKHPYLDNQYNNSMH